MLQVCGISLPMIISKDTTMELEKFLMHGIKDVEFFIEAIKNQV
jgi:hypothetical protein